MQLAIDVVLALAGYIVTTTTLGLAIGFSPILYGAFISTYSQAEPRRHQLQVALMGGIVTATILLLSFGAVFGVVFYYVTSGPLYRLIIGGLGGVLVGYSIRRLVHRADPTQVPRRSPSKLVSPLTMALLGFTKTILSALSIASALVASTLFTTIGDRPVITLLVALVICLGALAPLLVIVRSRAATAWIQRSGARLAAFRERRETTFTYMLISCGILLIIYALTR